MPVELRDALGEDLVNYYELGGLFAGEVDGTLAWLVARYGEWWYGPVVGPLFTDSVLAGWQRYDPTQYVPPIA